ncbi:glycosyltransferase family 2 protein [Granulicoccus phenolivorans]|uniref:glycosyltransferase family 2 protein n=1 Tax=Granulicoccus phenolivorans TaxID=266854 RepID=UPI00041DE6B6|nr:glycosyltransferase family 2 protein [Granulicoccus phenolivorans]
MTSFRSAASVPPTERAHVRAAALTVIVNFYNLGTDAVPALRSLARNTDPRIRFVLVDDASTDDTRDLLETAARTLPRTQVLALPDNVGLGEARNRGLALLDTPWFTFLDGDDHLAAGYLPALLDEVLAAGVPWVRTDHVETEGTRRTLIRIPDRNRAGRIGVPRDSITGARTTSVDFAHAWSGVYHRELAEAGIVHYPAELRTAEDRPAIWKLHLQVPAFTIARTVGVFYRRDNAGSLTRTGDVRQLAFLAALRQIADIVHADPEAERFELKLVQNQCGLISWHYSLRARFSPALRARFYREAAQILDAADPAVLAEAVASMPEPRAQAIGAVRRAGRLLAALPAGPAAVPEVRHG